MDKIDADNQITQKINKKKKLFYIIGGIVILIIIIVIISSAGEDKESEIIQSPQQETKEKIQSEIKEYNLQFTAEHISNRTFRVIGTTDLPNGSKIHITIYDEDYFNYDDANPEWRFENLTYFGESTAVVGEKFDKTLTASEMEAPLKSDKYEVEVSFNPRAQATNIKDIVGADGEYLAGEFIKYSDVDDFVMLETSKLIELKK